VQCPARLLSIESIRVFPVGFVFKNPEVHPYSPLFLLFLRLNRSEFADRRSPPCERALLVRIERREPGNEFGKASADMSRAQICSAVNIPRNIAPTMTPVKDIFHRGPGWPQHWPGQTKFL